MFEILLLYVYNTIHLFNTLTIIIFSINIILFLYFWIYSLIVCKKKEYFLSLLNISYLILVFISTAGFLSEGIGGYAGFLMFYQLFFSPVIIISWLIVFFIFKNK